MRTVTVRSRESPGTRSARVTIAVAPRSVETASVGAAVGDGDGVGVGAGVADGGAVGAGVTGGALAGGAVLDGAGDELGAGVVVDTGSGGLGRAVGAADGARATGAPGGSIGWGDADGDATAASGGLGGAGSKSCGATSWIADAMPPRNGIRATLIGSPSFCPTNARIARRPSMPAYDSSAVTISAIVRMPARAMARNSVMRRFTS